MGHHKQSVIIPPGEGSGELDGANEGDPSLCFK